MTPSNKFADMARHCHTALLHLHAALAYACFKPCIRPPLHGAVKACQLFCTDAGQSLSYGLFLAFTAYTAFRGSLTIL